MLCAKSYNWLWAQRWVRKAPYLKELTVSETDTETTIVSSDNSYEEGSVGACQETALSLTWWWNQEERPGGDAT